MTCGTCGMQKMLFLLLTSSIAVFSTNSATTKVSNGKESLGNYKLTTVTLTRGSGHSVLMQCELVISGNLLDVTWYKNGTNLTRSSHYDITQSFDVSQDRSVNSRSTLKITSLSTDDSGSYMCKLNSTDDGSKIFELIVVGSNALDLWLSGLVILVIIFVFILGIYILRCAFK